MIGLLQHILHGAPLGDNLEATAGSRGRAQAMLNTNINNLLNMYAACLSCPCVIAGT